MPTDTDLEVTKTACFKGDVARIKQFGEQLGAKEKSALFSQHVVTRALDALEEKLSNTSAPQSA